MQRLLFSFAVFISFTCDAQINLNQGLVAYYPFNGNTLDASGNGNNATNFGATLTSDQNGTPNSAYLFNGTSNYMTVPNNSSLQGSTWTLVAKVKPNGFYPGLCYNNSILDKGNGGILSGSLSLTYTPTLNQNPSNYCFIPDSNHENYRINVHTYATPALACITPVNAIPYIDTIGWDCVIGTYNDTTGVGSIYVNGVFRYSYTVPPSGPQTNNSNLHIGGTTFPTYPYYINGKLDEIRIYNRVINTQEIQALCGCIVNSPNINNLITTNDTSICNPISVVINTNNSIPVGGNYYWNTNPTLDTTNPLQAQATPTSTTTYYFNYCEPQCNLISNGDFESGNTGFTSLYNYTSVNTLASQIYVGTNTQSWNSFLGLYGDHTTGSTNMLMVNGSTTPNTVVWSSTVNVSQYTNYIFIAWVQNINSWGSSSSPPSLQLMVNGIVLGAPFNSTTVGGIWQNFSQTWNSGTSSVATINIIDLNLALNGNDFALDDISFYGNSCVNDSITITVNQPNMSVSANPNPVCIGSLTTLTASGALTYSWSGGVINGVPFIPTATNTYTVTGTDVNGCSSTSQITVTVQPLPPITASATPPIICSGQTTILTAIGGVSYTWSGGVTNGVPFTPTSTSTYSVTGTDVNGCISTSQITITVQQPPPITASASPPVICSGQTTTLTAFGGVSYTWSGSVINGVPFSPSATSSYTVVGTDAVGCTATSVVSIIVTPGPPVTAIASPSSLCLGSSCTLTASGALFYSWSGGITNGVPFNPTATTTYTLTGTDANGCISTSQITITVQQDPVINVSGPTHICEGDTVTLMATGAVNYTWSQANTLSANTGSTVDAFPTTTTTYTVTGSNAIGCSVTKTFTIQMDSVLVVQVTKNHDITCLNPSCILTATGATNYVWTPANVLSTSVGSTTTATVDKPTLITVIGNTGECTGSASILLNILPSPSRNIFIPTAFSPNDDNVNDCLQVVTNEQFAEFKFVIYNRWGQKVWETDNQQNCWNGFFQNERVPLATYYYYLKAKGACGEFFTKGDVIVVR